MVEEINCSLQIPPIILDWGDWYRVYPCFFVFCSIVRTLDLFIWTYQYGSIGAAEVLLDRSICGQQQCELGRSQVLGQIVHL